jgi:succinylglutamate desuccinylase
MTPNCEFEIQIPLVTLQNMIHLSKRQIIDKRGNKAIYNYNKTAEIIKPNDEIDTIINTKSEDYNYIRQKIFETVALKYRAISESPKEEIMFENSELESFKLRRKTNYNKSRLKM